MSVHNNYRWCVVTKCRSTTLKTPEKLFIKVPNDTKMKSTWLELSGRDSKEFSEKTKLHLCEDHFDLQHDMENYAQFKIMGSVKRIKMRPNTIPSKFMSRPDRPLLIAMECSLTRTADTTSTSCESDLQVANISHEVYRAGEPGHSSTTYESDLQVANVSHDVYRAGEPGHSSTSYESDLQVANISHEVYRAGEPGHSSTTYESDLQVANVSHYVYRAGEPGHSSTSYELDAQVANASHDAGKADKQIQVHVVMEYKSVQTNLTSHYRSKAAQINVKMRDTITSPMKMGVSVGTSPHNNKITAREKPSMSGVTRPLKRKLSTMFEEQSDSEVSHTPSVAGSTSQDFSPSKIAPTSDSSLTEELHKEDQKLYLQNTISKIKKKPKLYIGISQELYFLIHMIQQHTNISEPNILLCLTKIRLNSSFSQLGDDFGLSLSRASKIFSTYILPISKLLSSFIKKFDRETIKLNLPIAFRHRYHNISCIIDCLEIEIQKPTNAVHQALTWSEYKKANTMKYLVACTPDGMINYVSTGYGGRITDVTLVENSQLVDSLSPGACILADRGFKHIEAYLSQRNFTLMRPPSIIGGAKLTKAEVRQTKAIASLRITVERLIRRIREFAMLKPHSVVNINLVSVLDECIVTACALINLQDSLTK